jgi:hypothetical protein
MEKNPNASSSEEEDSDEESSSEEDLNKPALTREERRAAAKAKKEAAVARKKNAPAQPGDLPSSSEEDSEENDMPANPNHSKAARNQAKAAPASVDEATEGVKDMSVGGKGAAGKGKPAGELSRREREALQAQQAKERYQKLHEAGKTDEAKADLARLKLIREKREAEAARKQVGRFLPYIFYALLICAYRPRKKNARKLRRRRKLRLMHVKQRGERLLWVLRKEKAKPGNKHVACFEKFQILRQLQIIEGSEWYIFLETMAYEHLATSMTLIIVTSHIEEYPILLRLL